MLGTTGEYMIKRKKNVVTIRNCYTYQNKKQLKFTPPSTPDPKLLNKVTIMFQRRKKSIKFCRLNFIRDHSSALFFQYWMSVLISINIIANVQIMIILVKGQCQIMSRQSGQCDSGKKKILSLDLKELCLSLPSCVQLMMLLSQKYNA